jgi:hypothetical protein
MKKIFFICSIAISALAISTSASTNKQQNFYNYYALNDTVPNPAMDTMHHDMNMDTMHNNMMDTSMNMHRDSSKLAPPHQ